MGGGGSFVVDTATGAIDAGGDGISCAPAETETGEVAGDPGHEATATADGGGEVVDDSVVDDLGAGDPNSDPPVDGGTGEGGAADGETGTGKIPDTIDDGSVPDENTGDGTGEVTSEEVTPIDVTVTVFAFDCPAVPASGTDGCTPSAGVGLSASANGTAEDPATTDANGAASFVVPDGSVLIITEDQATIAAGYSPYGNGVAHLTAVDGGSVTFLHLLDPILGYLQVFSGTCPTPGDPFTEFRVIEPRSVAMADADSPECEVVGGETFTLSGGTLTPAIQITTGSNGRWDGYLPAGTYTVVDDSGASGEVTVIVDDTSVVMVIDYYSRPQAVLNVSRFACQDQAGVVISVHGSVPSAWDDNDCAATNGQVDVDIQVVSEVSAASIGTYSFDAAGQVVVELEPGSYKVVDVTSHQSTIVNLVGNTQVWVLIEDVFTQSGGVGEEPGGGDPGGGDPNDPDDPDDGTGANGGGTGGTGNPDGGPGGVDDTNGGMDAGSNDILDYDAELASVTGLPETGSGPLGNTDAFTLILVAGGLVVAAGAGRRLLALQAA